MNLYLKRRKKVLKKSFVGISLFILGATSFSVFSSLLKPFLPLAWMRHPLFPVLLMTLLSIAAYKPLDRLVTMFFRNVLFKHKSYAHLTLMNLAEELSLILDLQELANLVVNTFGEVLHLKTVALLIPNKLRGDYEIASAYGWTASDTRRIRLPKDSVLVDVMKAAGPHVLVRDLAIKIFSWQEASRLTHEFNSLQSGWVVPLFVKQEFTGALVFAARSPESIFDEADFQFFREFGRSLAKSLRNALCVNELKTANEELQDVQSHLLQSTKLSAIEQLATGIAHEIHNPLTIISGKAQVLLLQKDRVSMDERVEEVLKTIVKQTKRAADITRKLLMFSQSSGSPKEVLQLEQVLEDTISLVSYQTSLDGIELTRSVSGQVPPFFANVHELREVFLNLIMNSVQSIRTSSASGKIHCEIAARPSDQIVEIIICDSGKGISPENVEKLFNPFFTTRTDATGLGLFITKQIIHRYGGSIRVESRAGIGSLFIVQLPTMEMPVSTAPGKEPLPLFPNAESLSGS